MFPVSDSRLHLLSGREVRRVCRVVFCEDPDTAAWLRVDAKGHDRCEDAHIRRAYHILATHDEEDLAQKVRDSNEAWNE